MLLKGFERFNGGLQPLLREAEWSNHDVQNVHPSPKGVKVTKQMHIRPSIGFIIRMLNSFLSTK